MKMHGLRILILLLVASLIITILGCATTETKPIEKEAAVPTKTLKFAVIAPMTGATAQWGRAMQRAHEMAEDAIQEQGGIKVGEDRYAIENVFYDHKGQATEAVAAANKAIFQDEIKFITLHSSAPTLAAQAITEPNKIMTMTCGFAKLIGADKPYSFRPQYTGKESAEGIYGYIVNNMNIKTACMIGNDDDTGKSSVQSAYENAIASGIDVLDRQYVPRGTTDFYPTIAKMLTFNPDMIDLDSLAPADVALFIKQTRERGFKGIFACNSQNDIALIQKVAGDAYAEGYMQEGLDYSSSVATFQQREFYNLYTKKYNEQWDSLAGSYYAYPMSFIAGISAAQSVDTTTVSTKLPSVDMKILGVDMTWGGTQRYGINHQIVQPIFVSQIKNGIFTTVGRYTPPVP